MKLYHGTSARVARKAGQQGLKPRGKRKSNWDVPSRSDLVYLTLAYAAYFAAAASKSKERWGIVEVDVEPINLLPDEDFLEQATRDRSLCPLTDMNERTAWFRERLEGFWHHAEDSLDALGNAAHPGKIPPSAITRVVLFDASKAPFLATMALDPSISILNYRFMSGKYVALTRALMGYNVEASELAGLFWMTMNEEQRDVHRQALDELHEAIEIILP